VIITDQRGHRFIDRHMYQIKKIDVYRNHPTFGKLIYPLSMLWAVLQNLYFFYHFKPSAVMGFGGYTSIPGLLAARILNIPIFIHEGNAFLGQANRFAQRFAQKIGVSFPDTKRVTDPGKIVLTGFPLRKEFHNHPVLDKQNISDPSQLSILVVGGSQGAEYFSKLIPEAIAQLTPQEQEKIFIRQQCRDASMKQTTEAYSKLGCSFELKPFINDMPHAYAEADLVISRSGSSTLFEMACLGVPAIVIPFAKSAEGDQAKNAEYFLQQNACWLVYEKDHPSQALAQIIRGVLEDPSLLRKKAEAISNLHVPHAHKVCAQTLVSLAQ
ncbi:MAG: undecaprenyldiphospho-muramoylpentapeptide beta-N-acetylglucosaminyltransferase, partial [Alphaproteobacteria bacterium]|nr:undecaprenyldiphospho-muramoylpentapeptide beta-N-acetylglucosaminyltransferase [Alphaproteobacteria bacterium]